MKQPPHRATGNWTRPPGPVAEGLTIGLLGGSFNPAHDGHLYVSETARKRLRLDYVWWLVSPGNPLKSPADRKSFGARLASAQGVAAHHRHVIVTDIEQSLGTSFTVDTVAALQRRFPLVNFVWLMGSDNLAQFSRWRRWQQLAQRIPIVVVQRPGSIMAALNAALIRRFGTTRNPDVIARAPAVTVIDGARNGESATRLRALGQAPGAMLDT